MKNLHVIVAGLGWKMLEQNSLTHFAGLDFAAKESAFPAVTCVAQANLRTGRTPAEHGIIANGYWFDELKKPLFWEQSAKIVKGERVWDKLRAEGGKVGLFFFQQSLGEKADVIISPAPIHKHGGGMVMSVYTQPSGMETVLKRLAGNFPLWRYWGPLASPKVGRKVIKYFEEMTAVHDVDEAYLYLPTLDYTAQKYGPESHEHCAALKELVHQMEYLVKLAMRRGATMMVEGDYEIVPVTKAPVRPNVILRHEGFFKTREVAGRAYPDFYQSTAFAMCDHEICVIYGEKREAAIERLVSEGYVSEGGVLLAPEGSWCEYKWWTDDREAPDFASHVDIHNKPGFDPTELFFMGKGVVKGTHGRKREVAYA